MADNLAEGGTQGEGTPASAPMPAPEAANVSAPMSGPAEGEALLRWLRRLVTGLALAMGVGILAIAAVLWVRLGTGTAPTPAPGVLPALPPGLALPEGVQPVAITFARGWLVVVDATGEVLLFDGEGRLRQRVTPDQP